jgi:outer membrane receptor protein involved in Fe transport
MQKGRHAIFPSYWGWRWCVGLAAIASPFLPATEAYARLRLVASHRIDIPAQPLPQAVEELSRQTAVSIGADGALPNIDIHTVHGAGNVGEALAEMLAGTGYVARQVGPTAWRIEPAHHAPTAFGGEPAPLYTPSIIVTATKRSTPLADLPRAISVIHFAEGDRFSPARGSAAVADAVEGISLTTLGPGRNRMFLRGVADSPFNGASQSTVAVLVDDSRLTYSAPDPDLRLVDVARVEILKGPQGSLYGTGALGGLYHIVTNRADPDSFGGTLSLGANAVTHGGLGADGSVVVNLPLVSGSVGLRLVGYDTDEPGWITTGTRTAGNTTKVGGARADLGIEAGGGWRIDLSGLLQRIDAGDSQYTYAAGALSRPAQLPEPHDNDLNQISARAAGRIGAVDAVLVSGYSWHEVNDTFDATLGATSFGVANPQTFGDLRRYRVWDSEARFSGQLGRLRWLAGLSHVSASEHEIRDLTSATPAPPLPIDDSHRDSSDSGVFADVMLPLVKRVELDVGGRLSRSVLEAQRSATGELVAEETRNVAVTPSVALAWRPTDRRMLYVRYGSAFRQGGLNVDSDNQVHAFVGDELSTVEAGWRQQLHRGGQIDVGAYWTRWHHMQSDMLLPNGLIETTNAGEARIIGVEASLSRPVGEHWKLQLGGTAQSALLVRNDLGIAVDDRHLPAVPEYTARGGADYSFRVGAAAGVVRLAMHYSGPARLSFDPRLDRPMGHVLDSSIATSLDWGRSRVEFKLDNLFNRAGDTFAYGNPFRSNPALHMPQFTPQRPLSASVTIVRNF